VCVDNCDNHLKKIKTAGIKKVPQQSLSYRAPNTTYRWILVEAVHHADQTWPGWQTQSTQNLWRYPLQNAHRLSL